MKGSWDGKTILVGFLQWLILLLGIIIVLMGLYVLFDWLQQLVLR